MQLRACRMSYQLRVRVEGAWYVWVLGVGVGPSGT